MAFPDEEDWRSGKSLKECTKHILDSDTYSDVTFRVTSKDNPSQTRHIKALKSLLVVRSSVFEKMFCGGLPEMMDVIDVMDIEPEAFYEMLRYIYTDEVNLSEDIVMSVLYAAKKYLVTGLITHCEKFLENQVNPTNATVMLEQSIFWEAKALELQCMNIIQQDTQEMFASDAFLHSNDEVMRRILECDVLSVSEVKVFDACISWAQMKCQKHDVGESPATVKDMLGDLFYLIRLV